MTDQAKIVTDRVEAIQPLLAGLGPDVQGAILADLLAMWLAGHVVDGDQAATDRLRDDILQMHLSAMRPLIALNAQILGTD